MQPAACSVHRQHHFNNQRNEARTNTNINYNFHRFYFYYYVLPYGIVHCRSQCDYFTRIHLAEVVVGALCRKPMSWFMILRRMQHDARSEIEQWTRWEMAYLRVFVVVGTAAQHPKCKSNASVFVNTYNNRLRTALDALAVIRWRTFSTNWNRHNAINCRRSRRWRRHCHHHHRHCWGRK